MQHSAEVIELRNKMAELEEEKGNLQLQLLDSEEMKPGLQFTTLSNFCFL